MNFWVKLLNGKIQNWARPTHKGNKFCTGHTCGSAFFPKAPRWRKKPEFFFLMYKLSHSLCLKIIGKYEVFMIILAIFFIFMIIFYVLQHPSGKHFALTLLEEINLGL